MARALVTNRPEYTPDKANRLIAAMTNALPNSMADASVLVPGTAPQGLSLPDPKDVHVLAAAIQAGCSTIITFDLKHFPAGPLQACVPPMVAVHPDVFLVQLLIGDAAPVLAVIDDVRKSLNKSPKSVSAYAAGLEGANLPLTAELLRNLLRNDQG